MKKLLVAPVIALVFLMSSCVEENETSEVLMDTTFDLQTEETADANFEDVDDIVDAGVSLQSPTARVERNRVLDGATITHDTVNNIVTVDYGDGIAGPGGRIRSGKIIISYSDLRWVPGAFREVTFEDFALDSVQIEGVRRLENTSATSESAPQYTITLTGGKLTFTDGTTITREVNKVRTWNRQSNPLDDTITLTGTASGSKRDGTTYNVEILEAITFKRGCLSNRVFIPVSGSKLITSGADTALLDYGDGTCDNLATLSINGGFAFEFEINIRGKVL